MTSSSSLWLFWDPTGWTIGGKENGPKFGSILDLGSVLLSLMFGKIGCNGFGALVGKKALNPVDVMGAENKL